MGKYLGTTSNGIEVFDRNNSHLDAHPISKGLLAEAISKTSQTKAFEIHVVNMGRIVGSSNCVEVGIDDEVVMVQRKGRDGLTPFVKNKKPEPCRFITLILKKVGDIFVLITAFVGEKSEREPWDKNLVPGSDEHRRAVEFWNTHALIYET